jgi:hypothetical protein
MRAKYSMNTSALTGEGIVLIDLPGVAIDRFAGQQWLNIRW